MIDHDDPFNEIMEEGAASAGPSKPVRRINHVGNSGRYIVPFKELRKADLDELKPEQQAAYHQRKAVEEPVLDRAKFKGVVLYVTEDIGRALWPNGIDFIGTHPLCQSERTAAPFDNAFVNSKMDPIYKQTLKQQGHTGACSTCKISDKICKPRLIAYVVDLDHVKSVEAYNAANPENPADIMLTKIDAKGPQSTWNFRSLYNKLRRDAKAAGLTIGDYIVEFKSEPGSQGSKKVTFEVVEQIQRDNPLHSLVRILAREALESSKYVRKNFTANKSTQTSTPAGSDDIDGYVVPAEIPF